MQAIWHSRVADDGWRLHPNAFGLGSPESRSSAIVCWKLNMKFGKKRKVIGCRFRQPRVPDTDFSNLELTI